nr:uncharacterized protein LOC111413234 isoform X1 [Onthophagus taurus]
MYLESKTIGSLNVSYLKSFPCVLKLVQLICNTLITIIVAENWYRDLQTAYLIASIGALVLSSIIFLIKIHNIDKYIKNVPWSKLEVSYYTTWSVYYFIVIAQAISYEPYKIAQMISLISVITFMIDASVSYTEMKNEKCSCDSNFTKEENENFKNTKTLIV